MNSLFLLIILTQNGAGDITASFVNTETQKQCELKALMIEGIFSSARIPIVENHCVKSGLIFSPFNHSESSHQKRHFYQIQFGHEHAEIKPLKDWQQCKFSETEAGDSPRIYCSSSLQKLQKNPTYSDKNF